MSPRTLRVLIVAVALIGGAMVGIRTFDSMQTTTLRALAGALFGLSGGLMALNDRSNSTVSNLVGIASGTSAFSSLLLLYFDSPASSMFVPIVGAAIGIVFYVSLAMKSHN